MEALEKQIAEFLKVGSGSGYGCGGYGDGNGVKSFNNHKVYKIDSLDTIIYSVKGNIAKGAILCDDLTLEECYIAKVDNYFGHGNTAHEAYAAAESKALENEPIEKRIERFVIKYPDFDKKIPAQELFEWHHILTGSCEFGRVQFANEHNIDVKTDSFTTREFVKLTGNAYGGVNIKLLAKRYESVI